MGKFKIYLDQRGKKNKPVDYKHNLTVRVCHKEDTLYLNVGKITIQQYDYVFVKKRMDSESIEFRETCNVYITKCEKIFNTLKPFNREKFRELFFKKDDDDIEIILTQLKLKDLFTQYVNISDIGIKTKVRYKYTSRTMEKFKPDLTVWDITIDFLKDFERKMISQGKRKPTIESHCRDIRTILNYFTHFKKIIPKTYEYPFGKGGYSIGSTFSTKIILKEGEIKKVVDFNDFESQDEKFARDVWLFLYRCNGINFCDLLRLRWSDQKGDYFSFTRKKTERTRKNNVKSVVSPITEKLNEVLERIGNRNNPFILGQLEEGYTEVYFHNKSEKLKKSYNKHLKKITEKLKLSTPLNLNSARRTYATTLLRNGVSKDVIGEMLVHSNSIVTEHYLGSMDHEKTFIVNNHIL